MTDYFDQGFLVNTPAWHGLGEVLDHYPGREEGMRIAGHDFDMEEQPFFQKVELVSEGTNPYEQVKGWKLLTRSDTGAVLHVAKDSYTIIQNSVAWDVVDALVGAGAKYETGITLKGGAVCSVLAWLDEPVTIPGDNSVTLPYVCVNWAHDGSGALSSRATSVRVVCANTLSASEAEGRRLGTDFTFRHTANVMEKIEDAKMAMQGVRDSFAEFTKVAEELAKIPVTPKQRDLFVETMIPMPEVTVETSDRVKSNIEKARADLLSIFSSPTMPESHELTAYGLQLAGVEYLDHRRGSRNEATRYGRSLLRDEPAKKALHGLIREVVKA